VTRADARLLHWKRSSLSAQNGGCVEVAELADDCIGVRDSKNAAQGEILMFSRTGWDSFLADARDGMFDLF
jgi:hypothetical protein